MHINEHLIVNMQVIINLIWNVVFRGNRYGPGCRAKTLLYLQQLFRKSWERKRKEKLHTHDPDKLIRAKHQGESLNSLPTDKVYFKLIVLKTKSYVCLF